MKNIYESKNFLIGTLSQKPHISREDGGHIMIIPKVKYVDRTELSPEVATERVKLTMVIGQAMATAMNRQGVDIGRINYQDNGNWSVFSPEGPHLHVHLYGRAKSAKTQTYGEALHFPKPETGFYDNVIPMTDEDIAEIQKEIEALLLTEKYKNWN